MLKNLLIVGIISVLVALLGVETLQRGWPVGPLLLGLGILPVSGILLTKRSFRGAVPDLVFGAIDTGLLVIPAVWGGALFGVAGAIAGGIIGDALTDSIAGFFEGSVAKGLRRQGIEAAREPVTTALGKMTGCLVGSGITLTLLLLLGVAPKTF